MILKAKKGAPRYVEVFNTWSDYVNKAESTTHESSRRSSHEKENEYRWDFGLGFDGAIACAREGWKEEVPSVERFAKHVEANVDVELFQSSFRNRFDKAGSEVDISRFLAGEPECMIEAEPIRISRHGRAVRIVVPAFYSAVTDAEQIKNRGAAIVAFADTLSKCQHPLEIWTSMTCLVHGEIGRKGVENAEGTYVQLVKVQSANEPLDVARLLFAVAHPAAFRRLGFAVGEQCEAREWSNAFTTSNYGYPLEINENDLPEQVENTILLDLLAYSGPTWSEAYSLKWIHDTLATIFR